MNDGQDQQSKAEKINEKFEEAASKAVGPDVPYGSTPATEKIAHSPTPEGR